MLPLPGLSFNLSLVFGSFWLACLFLQISYLDTKINDLRDNPELPPLRCCLSRRTAAVSLTALLKWVTMESRSASSSASGARGANLPPIVAWKALITVESFSFSRSNLILGRVCFLDFLRRFWKVILTMFTWKCSGSGKFNT